MRPLDAYHGNHHLFWPRLSLRGRHSRRGLVASMSPLDASLPFRASASLPSGSASTAANAVDHRPEVPHASPRRDGALSDSFASVYDVLDRIAEERS